MDPITIGLQIAGLGMSLFGGGASIFGASKSNQINQQIAEQERLANIQRKNAMELNARRQQLQNMRNTQLQRSMSLNAATAQGAQFGTGLAGGLAQVTQQGNFNQMGINQNLEIGRNIFGINDRISGLKSELSDTQSQMAMWQGFGQLGSSLMKAGPTIGGLVKDYTAGGNSYNYGPNTYGGRYGYTSSNYGSGWN